MSPLTRFLPSPPPPDVSVTVTVSTVVGAVARVSFSWVVEVAVSLVDEVTSSLLATSKMPRLVVLELLLLLLELLLLLLLSVVDVDEVLKKIGAPGSRTRPSVKSSSPRPLS